MPASHCEWGTLRYFLTRISKILWEIPPCDESSSADGRRGSARTMWTAWDGRSERRSSERFPHADPKFYNPSLGQLTS
jgi:hypothetical protein